MTTYNLINDEPDNARNLTQFEGSEARAIEAERRSVLDDIDVRAMGTGDLEWLRQSARKAGHVDDVATLTAELESRVTP